jgi:hypothetical protein
MTPLILENVLSDGEYNKLVESLPDDKDCDFDENRSRYLLDYPYARSVGMNLRETARSIFNSNLLEPSYSLMARYRGDANMEFHVDSNACTYTIDMCVRQTEPWGLWVSGVEYILHPNQALCYLGNDHWHGRKMKCFPEGGFVEMIFFHYVEPSHWWFKGR